MSKEVLMSRRPNAMDTVDAARHSTNSVGGGGGYQPPPISNYKGVMLCDRPTTKAGGRAAVDSGAAMPFACAVGPGSKYEVPGLNPSREQRAAKLASDNKTRPRETNDFLSKHKQWLARLNKQRQQKNASEQHAVVQAVEKTRKFKEYAAKLRANIRQAKEQHATGYLDESALEDHVSRSQGSGPRSAPSKAAKSKKPAWALTEEGLEDQEEAEMDELLNFAAGLDYDQYIEDYEVKNALAAVKNRIAELAQGKKKVQREPGQGDDEGDVNLDDSGSEWKKAFVEGWNREDGGDERLQTARSDMSARSRTNTIRSARSEAGDDARSVAGSEAASDRDVGLDIAQEVLNTSRSMRKVHSSRSIRGILEKKKTQVARKQALDTVGEDSAEVGPTMPPPVTQVYHEQDQGVAGGGQKYKGKEMDASNLPYLHRNPAI